jgi:hypothetical protein
MYALTKMAIHTKAITFFAFSLSFPHFIYFLMGKMSGPNPVIISMLCNIELFNIFWWFT